MRASIHALFAALAGGGGSPPPPPAATWDPSNTDANISLSGGNLTATKASGDAVKSTRGNYGKAHGSAAHYFEVLVTEGGSSPFMAVGVGTSSVDLTSAVGANSSGWAYYQDTGEKYTNNTLSTYGASWTTGDVIGVAFKNGKVWFAKNNTWQNSGDPAGDTGEAFSGITGTIYPFATLYRQSSPAHVLVGRFTSADFTYSPPSGFAAWDS